ALPLGVGTIQVGILALHDVEPRQLEPTTLTDSVAFAALALRLLLDEQAGTMDGDLADALPLHSPQVHQATGMISAQLDVPMEDAFGRLRARAFTDQRPLAELASDVVVRRLRFDSPGEAT
ncbi:MAG: ANTAR domain-containing protein, partial [Actinobacteria bacterium]|nr:ANTAR domain-containing protein [Actinomycetota bacterium]